ncbi:MAG: hypothetical protein Q9183_001946 [Haloplaca sp. 2 TL-2023]
MGGPPAVVFVVRHGARLDAANRQWHLTSPTPYDPPLTYGGWVQSRMLGNRIGSILHTKYGREEEKKPNYLAGGADGQRANGASNGRGPSSTSTASRVQRQKYNIIIHTSPFQRCIQTSIAIAAGAAQFDTLVASTRQENPSRHNHMHSEMQHPVHPTSPSLNGAESTTFPHLSAIPEPADSSGNNIKDTKETRHRIRARLRVDAFLGEWLSPEYFDLITPPPSSVMMVTSAKTELMRQGEYIDAPAGFYKNMPGKGNFPGGWGSQSHADVEGMDDHDSGPLSSISTIGATLPRLNRASSHHSTNPSSTNARIRPGTRSVSKIETSTIAGDGGYEPPTPTYAISPSDPIPPGYVAHARDACVDIDFQWDSMRRPHDWGNGGEFGEEWSAMHKRFRRGLDGMIDWYQENHVDTTTQDIIDGAKESSSTSEEVEDDTITALVLVTHGAGCNALIGAITNQPVLLDVGMSSLTMATLKQDPSQQSNPTLALDGLSPQRSKQAGVSDDYEIKITASTDHLRNRPHSSTIGVHNRSPSLSSAPLTTHRYRTSSAASTASSSSISEDDFDFGSGGHAMGSVMTGDRARSASPSGGLWSKPVAAKVTNTSERLPRGKAISVSGHSPLAKEVLVKPNTEIKDTNKVSDQTDSENGAPGHPTTQRGLWGAPPTTTSNEREKGPKRRWTHSDHR